jgi:tripartite-type tricarboxylate transporter receptor subunit TctC
MWLPPGVPDDMFRAWSDMMKKLATDKEFIELSRAGGQDVGYMSGERLQELIYRAQKLSPEGIDLLRRLATGK